jgi:peptidoglycan/xylan/chitin deacetylase (PgdA/CDA1 family)
VVKALQKRRLFRILFLFILLALGLILGLHDWHRGVVILHYHSVSSDKGNEEKIRVFPNDFEWQMDYLKRAGYHVVTLQKAVDYLQRGGQLPSKSVAITFDDGYEDNYTQAFPILKKYHYPATIFMVTGEVGGTNSWDKNKMPTKRLLNWTQIEEMQKGGISFQAHTVHHLNITKIPQEKAKSELAESKRVLEKHLKTNMDFFAYPFGSISKKTVQLVRETGFKAAFTSSPGINAYGETDSFRIRRMPVKEIQGGFWGHLFFKSELKFSWLLKIIESMK